MHLGHSLLHSGDTWVGCDKVAHHTRALSPRKSILCVLTMQVCCELMTPEEAPALRAAAAGVVSAVVSLADELAGVLAATVPQLTDRLMDLLGLMGSGGALAAAADGAATADGASAFASVAMFAVMRGGGGGGGGARQRADTGGGDGDGDAALGVDGSEGVAALQQRLQHDAEACVLAMEVLMQLAQNPWAQVGREEGEATVGLLAYSKLELLHTLKASTLHESSRLRCVPRWHGCRTGLLQL